MDLRGASAEAVAELADELAGAEPGDLAAVAGDLFTVAATIRAEGALRRFVTDGSLPTEARTGLLREVFGGKVADGTLEILSGAASRRWTSSRDLAPGLEHLGVVATVRSAGDDTARLSDELFAFDRAVKDNPTLRDALSDPARTDADKTELVDALVGSRALPATTALVKQAVVGSHRTVSSALTSYQQVAADVQGERVATVRVARELSDSERDRLAAALAQQYGRDVHVNVLVDPEVLGGVRVEIGDDVIDGTVSARLDDARRLLAG